MKLFYSDHDVLPLPAGHFCPMWRWGTGKNEEGEG
jgi:hypothetical protein